MARLFWLTVMAAFGAALVLGVSWVFAYTAVANVLGSPPPEMGTQYTALLWQGAPELSGHPRVWRFAFGPPRIPRAPTLRIYVPPLRHVLQTQPAGLEAPVKVPH